MNVPHRLFFRYGLYWYGSMREGSEEVAGRKGVGVAVVEKGVRDVEWERIWYEVQTVAGPWEGGWE